MKLLTKQEQEPHKNTKICYICEEKFENQNAKAENIVKLEIIVIIGAAHSTYNLKQSLPKNIPIVFHNGSDYDYHFIMKELAEEFKKQFTCLGENTDKYTTFTVPIKKVTRTDKD